ncbi:MAG: PEP-CTERM sorting domain-containing protein [Terracidiphilus sp.]
MKTMTCKPPILALAALLLCACLAPRAFADDVTIANLTAISGQPGDSITVYGDLTNNSSSTLYFNNDAINLSVDASVATASDDLITNAILGFGPASMDPGDSITGVDLFTLNLAGGSGVYTGNTFDLYGGTCLGPEDCNDQLGGGVFSFEVNNPGGNPAPTPEPATFWLLAGGLFAAAFFVRRRFLIAD